MSDHQSSGHADEDRPVITVEERSPKSPRVAFSLACLGGFLGLHRFYTGHPWTGLAMLLTLGGLFMWWLIDAAVLLTGRFKDGEGRVLGPPRQLPRHEDRRPISKDEK